MDGLGVDAPKEHGAGQPSQDAAMEAHALAEMVELADDDSRTWLAIGVIGACAPAVAVLTGFVVWRVL